MSNQTIFILGATGFVGGNFISLLSESHPDYHLACLLRNPTPTRVSELQNLNSNISIVEGTLDDAEIISRKAEEVDIVIHLANSDHLVSVEAVLNGLTRRAERNPKGTKPIYIHMSGLAIICDNVRGEKVEYVKEWTDIDLDLDDCPPNNTHLPCDRKILEIGSQPSSPVRTSIIFPAMIYGFGKSARSTSYLPPYVNFARKAGHSGTWGPGEVDLGGIHVRDTASAVVCILQAMLDGKVQGGKDALFFNSSQAPTLTWKEIASLLGDIMYDKGLIKEPGSKPFPPEITDIYGEYLWSLLGSNAHGRSDRLRALGWDDEWTKKESVRSLMPKMIEVALAEAKDL